MVFLLEPMITNESLVTLVLPGRNKTRCTSVVLRINFDRVALLSFDVSLRRTGRDSVEFSLSDAG